MLQFVYLIYKENLKIDYDFKIKMPQKSSKIGQNLSSGLNWVHLLLFLLLIMIYYLKKKIFKKIIFFKVSGSLFSLNSGENISKKYIQYVTVGI